MPRKSSNTTAGASSLKDANKPQLEAWKKTKEPHEQVAVGEKTGRSKQKTKAFIDEVGRKIEGKRM
ncbi:MAG: hypothetical protein Q9164_001860 [Protoblastenia rupestris]